MLRYKCHQAGVWFKEVNESYTTQACHVCHERTVPKGQTGLGVREWTCSHCGAAHLRDHKAAINIRARGLRWLEAEMEISTTSGQAYAPGLVVNKAFWPRPGMAVPLVQSPSKGRGGCQIERGKTKQSLVLLLMRMCSELIASQRIA